MSISFDPNAIGIPNGNYFGFPYSPEESDIVLLSVPWDATTSYKAGTSKGPKAIINASVQVDLFDFDVNDAWKIKLGTIPISKKIKKLNAKTRKDAEKVISFLENGISQNDAKVIALLEKVNHASVKLNDYVFHESGKWLLADKKVGVVGGEHSVPLGLINALSKKYSDFGILHIDAHADLRKAYEGFEFSHASILFNALKFGSVSKLVQVGIRDVCQEEMDYAKNNDRIVQFSDYSIKENAYTGKNWHEQTLEIVSHLPEKVYISFDIDGLSPEFCPNTGTPVPGGLTFNEAIYLVKQIKEIGREIIGFDLNEVAPGNDEWDANVGARVLFKLCLAL